MVLTGQRVQASLVEEGLTFTGEDSPLATLLLSVMGAFAEFDTPQSVNVYVRASLWPRPAAPTAADDQHSARHSPGVGHRAAVGEQVAQLVRGLSAVCGIIC